MTTKEATRKAKAIVEKIERLNDEMYNLLMDTEGWEDSSEASEMFGKIDSLSCIINTAIFDFRQ